MTTATPTVAVTGADGFLGRAVVRAARAARWQLIPLGRRVDVTDAEGLREATKGATVILHLAAVRSADPVLSSRVNVLGTVHALEAARRHGASFVLASSFSARAAQDPYGLSKRSAEEWCEWYSRAHAMDVCILRIAALYGPGARWNSLVQMAASDPIRVTGDGTQRRDYLHVDDAAAAVLAAVPLRGLHRSDVGTGVGLPLREVASWFGRSIAFDEARDPGPAEVVAEPPQIPWRPARSGPDDLKRYIQELARMPLPPGVRTP